MTSYKANDYTEEEIIKEILRLDDPTDNELEARIVEMIKKYDKGTTSSDDEKELYKFFNDVYSRFFDEDVVEEIEEEQYSLDDDDDDNYKDEPDNYLGNQNTKLEKQTKDGNESYAIEAKSDNIKVTKQVDLIKGKVNPLLLQTIRRVISIDSQYRPDPERTLSGEFTFNLSDPLKDVVSLKLYSIGIPYTWYTVNQNFGSNFLILKGNTPGIDDGTYDISASIPTGNYAADELVTTINTNLQSALRVPSIVDMSFGNTGFTYNVNRSRSTFNFFFRKVHTLSSYEFEFENWTTPNSTVPNDNRDYSLAGTRFKSIPGFLGFNKQRYFLNALDSSRNLPISTTDQAQIDDDNEKFYLDSRPDVSMNNYFKLIHYVGPDTYSNTSTIKNTYDISLTLVPKANGDVSGNFSRKQIFEQLNKDLSNTPVLQGTNLIIRNDISNGGLGNDTNSYYTLSLNFNRDYIDATENSRMYIEFPNESELQITDASSVWTGSSSALRFIDISCDISTIKGESQTVIDDTKDPIERIDIAQNGIPYYEIRCIRPFYNVPQNNFSVNLGSDITNSGISSISELGLVDSCYNSLQFDNIFNALKSSMTVLQTNSVTTNEPTGVIDVSSTFVKTDDGNHIDFKLDLLKKFNNTNYQADISLNHTTDISCSLLYKNANNQVDPDNNDPGTFPFYNEDPNSDKFNFNFDLSQSMVDISNNPIYYSYNRNINVDSRKIYKGDGIIVNNTKPPNDNFIIKISPKDSSGNQESPPYIVNIFDYIDLSYDDYGQFVGTGGTRTKHGTNGTIKFDVSYDIIIGGPDRDGSSNVTNHSYQINNSSLGFDNVANGRFIDISQNDQNFPDIGAADNVIAGFVPIYPRLTAFINYMFDNFTDYSGNNPIKGTKLSIHQYDRVEDTTNQTYKFMDASLSIVVNESLNRNDYEIQFFDPNNKHPVPILDVSKTDLTVIDRSIETNFWVGQMFFDISFVDISGVRLNDIHDTISNPNGKLIETYDTLMDNSYVECKTNLTTALQPIITIDNLIINETNDTFKIKAWEPGVITNPEGLNDFTFTVPHGTYLRNTAVNGFSNLIETLNSLTPTNTVRNSIFGVRFNLVDGVNDASYVEIVTNGYKKYTSADYKLVFYDDVTFAQCYSGVTSIRNTTSDATLGWLLGFRNRTQYDLSDNTATNYQMTQTIDNSFSIIMEADSVVTTDLYNKLFIVLDDYNQSRLNDGLITNITNEETIELPSYATRNRVVCDPVTGEQINDPDQSQDVTGSRLTQNLAYAANENRKAIATGSTRTGGKGPFAKDVFAVIPIKTNALDNGATYTEFGGTLQNQERIYFGPVNISRMSVKLLTDRGDVVDLNGADWTFSLIAEQLYQSSTV